MVSKPSTDKSKRKRGGNYIDAFVKQMFGRVFVFADFLLCYADPKFVSEVDLTKIQAAPTHYIGQKGDERIVDLVFQCPLRSGSGSLLAVVVFEHMSGSLKEIPQKLLRYISAIWDAETKEGKKVLSAPYFIVLRTGKKPFRKPNPTMAALLPKDKAGKPLGHIPEIRYDVVDLPSCDFDKLAGGSSLRLVLGMLHKMTGDAKDDFPAALLPLLEITDECHRVELTKELLDFAAKAFAAHNRRLDEEAVSKALQLVFGGKEKAMMKTIFEEREAIGEARGKAETVLTVLQARFKRVPKKVESAIRQLTDPIALDSWAVLAATCQSIDEFAAFQSSGSRELLMKSRIVNTVQG